MARPRTIDVDCVQTFHCSYVLRTALLKAAATTRDANVSNFMRKSVEASCQRTLGPGRWSRLQSAANRQVRRSLLEGFLQNVDVTRIRRGTDAARGTKPGERVDDLLSRVIDDYGRTFQSARDQQVVDLALAVALEEAVDTVQKIKTILLRTTLTKSALQSLQHLAAKFPDSLRADFDAAILSRVVAKQFDHA